MHQKELLEKLGWTKRGSLWVSPLTHRQWAWTDKQMEDHLKESITKLENLEGIYSERIHL